MEERLPGEVCNPERCHFCVLSDEDYLCYFQKSSRLPYDAVVTHFGAACIYRNSKNSREDAENLDKKIAERLAAELTLGRLSDPQN
jgi:hypothetical protein